MSIFRSSFLRNVNDARFISTLYTRGVGYSLELMKHLNDYNLRFTPYIALAEHGYHHVVNAVASLVDFSPPDHACWSCSLSTEQRHIYD